MRLIPSLILVAIGFSAGAAVAQYVSRRPAPAASPAEDPPAASAPASTGGERDPRSDLRDQMMWDPTTATYEGG